MLDFKQKPECNRKLLTLSGEQSYFFVKNKVEKNKEKKEKYFSSYKRALMISDKISLTKVNSRKNSFWA
jgi:hypothetical protein